MPSTTMPHTPQPALDAQLPFVARDTILVVDDNTTNLKVLCDFLHSVHYKVAIARSGEQALETAARIAPEIILLDVMMPPGIDGFETCTRLKADPKTRHIPVILLTALSDPINKIQGLSAGAVDYITKPFEQAEVLARINVHLSLRKAQVRLVQEEKMAALGQLVAGIAHEINNPASFIHGNLKPATEYVNSLFKLIELYETHTATPPEVKAYAEEIELDYIKQDIFPMLGSMRMGTERIRKIVGSLRTFSHLDESGCKSVDLHEGLESILTIVDSRLTATSNRAAIRVTKQYAALPPVECHPGHLNQALMNLVVNAIDSLDEKWGQRASSQMGQSAAGQSEMGQMLPELILKTEVENQQVKVVVIDNGLGIPKAFQPKIFDQFFTTKPVGQGTGLGLTLARSIVTERHQGSLTFQSEPGQGSHFSVTLPLRCSASV